MPYSHFLFVHLNAPDYMFSLIIWFSFIEKTPDLVVSCHLHLRVEYQLPNLIVAAITKESLYNAFDNGITGEQASIQILVASCYI